MSDNSNVSNSGDFFVMLTTQEGSYTPLQTCTNITECEAEFARFETRIKAREAALDSVLGDMYGYEIFEIGYGDK